MKTDIIESKHFAIRRIIRTESLSFYVPEEAHWFPGGETQLYNRTIIEVFDNKGFKNSICQLYFNNGTQFVCKESIFFTTEEFFMLVFGHKSDLVLEKLKPFRIAQFQNPIKAEISFSYQPDYN